MALHDDIRALRETALASNKPPVQSRYQGVDKTRIEKVLRAIDRYSVDRCDAVFALLDDEHDSWFKKMPSGAKLCHGATTAQIACHIGILQRGAGKLDREGRDYWSKPLWEIGAIEKVFLDPETHEFIVGHPIPKSPNSAYRLSEDFKRILQAPESEWRERLDAWMQEDQIRQRLDLQAKLAEQSRERVDTNHSDLIRAACQYYVQRFLPGYEILYVDDADGDRVAEADRHKLYRAGISLELADSMPDVLLWNPQTDWLWVIEAVTSDGEVDYHKQQNLTALAKRSGKAGIGFTTVYRTWSAAAARQHQHKNLAPGSYLWIQEDPSKHFLAEAFAVSESE